MCYLLSVLFWGACGVVAQDLQQVADGMTVKSPVAGQKKLVMPAHPKGTRVKVLAAAERYARTGEFCGASRKERGD